MSGWKPKGQVVGRFVSCPNNSVCQSGAVQKKFLDDWCGTCFKCARVFGKPLEFTKALESEVFESKELDFKALHSRALESEKLKSEAKEFECPICLEKHAEGVYHPAGCGHVFCTRCIRRIFFGPALPDPRDYGWTGDQGDERAWQEFTESDEAIDYFNAFDEIWDEIEVFTPEFRCAYCRKRSTPDWETGVGAWADKEEVLFM